MSYHVQQSSQQKSLGIIVVVAFHVLLITGLILGLKVQVFPELKSPIIVDNIKEKPVPVDQIDEPIVNINTNTKIAIPENPIKIDIDTPPIVPDQTDKTSGGTIVQSSMSKPKLQNATTPAYPAASARMEEQGTTRLNLYITADGRVSEATVVSSSGYSRLDDAAVKHALHAWRFTPCVDNGTAVGCWFQTNLVWKLENAKR